MLDKVKNWQQIVVVVILASVARAMAQEGGGFSSDDVSAAGEWMDKQNVVHSFSGILFSLKKGVIV